jgi:transcriptional regulator with XRE-family HTH domain
MTLAADLGRILTQHREANGLSRKALADRHGLAANTLREVELGQANPTIGRIEELSRIYELDLMLVPANGPVAAVAGRPVARAQ